MKRPRKADSVAPQPLPEPASAVEKTPEKSFPIIGIGASAGGLEAFRQLLQNLPAGTGAAFVLVQHLSPTHESILPALLARSTMMPVAETEDGVRIEPDHVYVIPADKDVAIEDGHLKLLPRDPPPAQHMPVDLFFRTLAQVRTDNAVGVVLSGTGSDGALGLQAIKAAGGLCFAQDAQSAAFDGMPQSAIASGSVDAVLSPEGIAREIARLAAGYLRPPRDTTSYGALLEDERSGLDTAFALIRTATGNDLTGYKKATLLRRIRRRMALLKIEGLSDYAGYLQSHPGEVQDLHQDLLIHVTSFFRNPQTFETLSRDVFPRLLEGRTPEAPVRIWVPGCSTGEEVYSIAICLLECLGGRAVSPPIQIFGTDLRESAVEKARAGIYLENIAADVSPERLERFFTRTDGQFQVSKTVRDLCVFARHDLIRDPPFSRLDLISCRNVLIYLEPGVQRRVMASFRYALNLTGLLVLGGSETVIASSDLFRPVDREHRIYAPQAGVAHTIPVPILGTYPGAILGVRPEAPLREAGVRGELQREADRFLLSRYAPAGVLVDENLEVLQFRGDTHPYLQHESGSASLQLLRIVQKGLLPGVREMIQEAKVTGIPVRRPGLTFRYRQRFHSVDVEAVPIQGRSSGRLGFLLLFLEPPEADRGQPEAGEPAPSTPRRETDRQILRLEQELATTQQYLQAIIEDQSGANEELQTANEDILSSNEELQSLNEELETAKEELQSGNEELTTLNDELMNRNQELGQLGDDLANLLAGLQIPVVLLSSDLRVRRFTPAAARLMNLIPADIDRPLHAIRPNFDLPLLEEWLQEAMETAGVVEREIQDGLGSWYSLRILPYKTRDNRIDGALMVLVDINSLKLSAAQVTEARELADAIIETGREPLLILDGKLRVERANQAFCDLFQVSVEAAEGRLFYDLGDRQWKIPAVRLALEALLAEEQDLRELTVEQDFARIGRRTMTLNARRVRQHGGKKVKILLAIEDRTGVREAEEERFAQVALEQKSAREAQAANRLKDDFLATVSHELRGPLSAIAGWVHVLAAKRADEATTTRGLESIERNVQAQARLIEDLLDAARITTGKLRLTPRIIDLLPVVEAAIDTVRLAAEAKGVTLHLGHDGTATAVLGDADRLQQIAWNLLSNAVKFTPGGGRVEAWLGRVANSLHLRISDTGQGIRTEFLPYVFERFRQEESTPTRNQGGLGLGLSIVRDLAELHGGTVEVASDGEGRGATFTLHLPVPALLPAEPTDRRQPLTGLRLLVVEDETTNREMLAALLEQYGAEVTATASAAEAMAALSLAIPDVLLSDIGMPGESGYDLMRQVRALPPHRGGRVPALAFTAYATIQDRQDCLDAGFQAHLAKPTDPARLVALITGLAQGVPGAVYDR